MEETKINFEAKLDRLKEIVSLIEDDHDLPLDDCIKLYEEGNQIIALLEEELKKAEQKVENIVNTNNK